MFDYGEMQGIAKELLAEFGQGEIFYIELVPGNGPPENPGAPTPAPHKLDAVAKGVGFKYVDNSTIFATDFQIVMPGGGVVPDLSGFVQLDGVQYKVIRVVPNPAAGTVVAYTVIFRK